MSGHSHFRAWLALIAVCFFWGTTYLGIRIALEYWPPLWIVSLRFIVSGVILLSAARMRGAVWPTRRELAVTARNGILVLGIGSTCLTYAETFIPSGIAALFVTTSPFWLVTLESLFPGGERLHGPTLASMLVGLAGAALLVVPLDGTLSFDWDFLRGFALLQFSCFCWTYGSLMQKRAGTAAPPYVQAGIQQIAAGVLFFGIAYIVKGQPIVWHWRGVAAVLYLAIFGSLVGYTSYVFALAHLPVATVSIYNYVNPVVAVFLGWLTYGEPLGAREVTAMLVIFAGVALVKRSSARRPAVMARDAKPAA